MKKLLFTLVLVSLYTSIVNAQNKLPEGFLLAIMEGDFGRQTNLYLDSGIHVKRPLKDSLGKTIKFETPAAALNYLSAHGWSLVSAIPDVSGGGRGVSTRVIYLFKKEVEKDGH